MKKAILLLLVFVSACTFAQNKITPEFLWKLGRISEPRISPDGKTVIYNVRTFDVAANSGNSDVYKMDADGKNVTKLAGEKENETNAKWRPDGQKIAFISTDKDGDSQIWEMNPDGTAKVKISFVPTGVTNFGYSPKAGYIWYTTDIKLDKNVTDLYPDLPKANARIIDQLMYRHWNVWSDYTYSHLFVVKYANSRLGANPVDVMPDEKFDTPMKPDGGEEQISFSNDDKKIAYTCKKLSGTAYAISTNSDIYVYDIESGKTENVSAGMPGYDMNPRFSPDGSKMIWLSMQDAGYEADRNRLFIYDIAAKSKTELLEKFDYSVSNAQWSGNNMIYFSAGMNGVDQILSYDFSLKTPSKMKQITNLMIDVNEFSISEQPGKPVMIASCMSISMPTEVFSIDLGSGATKQISSVNNSNLSTVKMGNVEKRMIKTSDGKDMLTWVIYPPDFDKTKKYPTLLYCQGGPQSTVSQFFSYRWNFQLMAANGYIVVAPNRRGLPSFGEEWNDKITGDWGGQACTDYLSAIDDVAKESYVDKAHLGCVGASYGGFSAYWLAGHHNKRFKAFIAHCGVFNLESEFGSTEEMWFPMHDFEGPYWKTPKPKSFDTWSPHKFVQNWDTPILVIHNEKDFRVPVTQGMEAFTAAQMQNIPSRFLYFPEEGHWVMKPQNSILWQRVFFGWLDKYLK